MKRRSALAALAVLAALCFPALPPAVARETMTVMLDGVNRTALVDPGKEATTVPSPLVFVFHGSGSSVSEVTSFGLAKTWPEATFVYPAGPARRNSVLGSTFLGLSRLTGFQFVPGEFDDQDVRFVDALLEKLGATYQVDERRVFATGMSNGGAFCYLLLTLRPERFAAFASVAGVVTPTIQWARVPRPMLLIHGRTDFPIHLASAERARNQLQRLNGCGSDTTEWARGAVSFQPCTSGQPIIWSLHSGGHEWPKGATAQVVRFFQEHSLPAPPPTRALPPSLDTSSSVAGTGQAGFSGEGSAANMAQLLFPESVALDPAGNLDIVDTGNQRVRRVGADGTIQTVAGQAASSAFLDPDREGIVAARAHLFYPEGIVSDRDGNLFIADTLDRLVRKVTPDGLIKTVAGKRISPEFNSIRYSGDGGPATRALLSFPTGLAVDRMGNLYIADSENHRIRKVGPDGIITTVAGTGILGFTGDGGAATQAQLNEPWGLAVESMGNLYIADASNHRIRKMAPDGTITSVAGTGTPGFSGDEGAALAAQLNRPLAVAVDTQGNLFIVDSHNYRIRRVAPNGMITTVFGGGSGGGSATSPGPYYPSSVAIDRAGNLLIADPFNHRIWKVPGLAAPGLIAGQPFPAPEP